MSEAHWFPGRQHESIRSFSCNCILHTHGGHRVPRLQSDFQRIVEVDIGDFIHLSNQSFLAIQT